MNKFNAKKTVYDGKLFDSKKEAHRWAELLLLEKAGIIRNLRRQVPFELIPTQREVGQKTEKSVQYIADFVYEKDGKTVVEDVKGKRTDVYILKRKLMLWVHGIRILET